MSSEPEVGELLHRREQALLRAQQDEGSLPAFEFWDREVNRHHPQPKALSVMAENDQLARELGKLRRRKRKVPGFDDIFRHIIGVLKGQKKRPRGRPFWEPQRDKREYPLTDAVGACRRQIEIGQFPSEVDLATVLRGYAVMFAKPTMWDALFRIAGVLDRSITRRGRPPISGKQIDFAKQHDRRTFTAEITNRHTSPGAKTL